MIIDLLCLSFSVCVRVLLSIVSVNLKGMVASCDMDGVIWNYNYGIMKNDFELELRAKKS